MANFRCFGLLKHCDSCHRTYFSLKDRPICSECLVREKQPGEPQSEVSEAENVANPAAARTPRTPRTPHTPMRTPTTAHSIAGSTTSRRHGVPGHTYLTSSTPSPKTVELTGGFPSPRFGDGHYVVRRSTNALATDGDCQWGSAGRGRKSPPARIIVPGHPVAVRGYIVRRHSERADTGGSTMGRSVKRSNSNSSRSNTMSPGTGGTMGQRVIGGGELPLGEETEAGGSGAGSGAGSGDDRE